MAAGKSVRLNNDTRFLKLIAIVTMTIDHVGAVLFPQYAVLRTIGRIAFPLFAYCIAAGCVYTHSMGKYALRVGLLAVLVQPLYMTALDHQAMAAFDWRNLYRIDQFLAHYGYFNHLNILFTLLIAILIIWTIREKCYALTAVLATLVLTCSSAINYGTQGVVLVLLFYAFIDRPGASFAWIFLLMLRWGMPTLFTRLDWTSYNSQLYAMLALPLIYLPMKTGIKVNKYIFYLFYPVHLAAIYLIRYFA